MNRQTPVLLLLFVLMLCATAADATRLKVRASFEGRPIAGARVCFSPASVGETVLDGMLSGPESRCLPADKIFDVPPGVWHYYVVSEEPFLVSAHPTKLRIVQGAEDGGVKTIASYLSAAGTLDFTELEGELGEGEFVAVYVSHRGSTISNPALVPVSRNEMKAAVPAATPLVPLIMSAGGNIRRVGVELTVGEGEEVAPTLDEQPVAVVPYRLPSVIDRKSLSLSANSPGTEPQQLDLATAGTRGLFFVRGNRKGLVAVSEPFGHVRLSFEIPDGVSVLVTPDVTIQPKPKEILVDYRVEEAFAKWRPKNCSEEGPDTEAVVRLLRCPEAREPQPLSRLSCREIESHQVEQASGQLRFQVQPEPDLWVELRQHHLAVRERVEVTEQTTRIPLELEPIRVHGRVTDDAVPARAEVVCGNSSDRVDEAGAYDCWIDPTGRPTLPVMAVQCDGSGAFSVTLEEVYFDRVFDIEFPEPWLSVRVIDSATGRPLDRARVLLSGEEASTGGVMRDTQELGFTDPQGILDRLRIMRGSADVICAVKRNYRTECQRVPSEKSGSHALLLRMERGGIVAGRLENGGDVREGTVHVAFGGKQVEQAALLEDGSFNLAAPLRPDATLFLISSSHPLTLLEIVSGSEEVVARIPPLNPISFSVNGGEHIGRLGLMSGHIIVPLEAFARHQLLRHQQYVVRPGWVVRITDVNGLAPVTVLLDLSGVPVEAHPFGDPSLLNRMLRRMATSEHLQF